MWQRRLAIQLASQLPEEPADARAVLDATRQLLDEFLVGDKVDKPKSAKIIGLVGRGSPEPPQENSERRKGWGRVYKATATAIATFLLASIVPIEPGTANMQVATISAFLADETIAQGESLRVVMSVVHTFDCPGTNHKGIWQGNRQVLDIASPSPRHDSGTLTVLTRHVPVPDLPPGDYVYQSWTDFACPSGYRERAASPRLAFRIVDKAAVGP